MARDRGSGRVRGNGKVLAWVYYGLAALFVAVALFTYGGPSKNPLALPLFFLALLAAIVGGVVQTIARRARGQ